LLYDAISCHMFSWAPLLVMGPGTVYSDATPLANIFTYLSLLIR